MSNPSPSSVLLVHEAESCLGYFDKDPPENTPIIAPKKS